MAKHRNRWSRVCWITVDALLVAAAGVAAVYFVWQLVAGDLVSAVLGLGGVLFLGGLWLLIHAAILPVLNDRRGPR